jgi:hypothetical protein
VCKTRPHRPSFSSASSLLSLLLSHYPPYSSSSLLLLLSLSLMGPSAPPLFSLFISTLSPPSFFLSLLLSWDLAPSPSSLSPLSLLLLLLSISSLSLFFFFSLFPLSHFPMRPSSKLSLNRITMQQRKVSILSLFICILKHT